MIALIEDRSHERGDRLLGGAWHGRQQVRMKCTRHLCHWVLLRTLATAAPEASWASDTTRRTPLSPRLTRARRKRVQKDSSSLGPQSTEHPALS